MLQSVVTTTDNIVLRDEQEVELSLGPTKLGMRQYVTFLYPWFFDVVSRSLVSGDSQNGETSPSKLRLWHGYLLRQSDKRTLQDHRLKEQLNC